MKSKKSVAFGVSACVLLMVSIISGRQQGELSGIRGIPVDGHEIVAGVEVVGTKHYDHHKIRERLQQNGADLRLGWPLENQTLCRFNEVLRDVMSEKGYPDAEITYDTRPTYGDPRQLTLTFTISEGKRHRRATPAASLPSPAERCSR